MPLIASTGKQRVILGLMTFGPDPEGGARITDVAEYGKVLDLFQARGYNEIDTARIYVDGKQEAFTREAGWKDRGLTLATKVVYPKEHGMNQAAKVTESVHTSLKELGTDCVDLLYLHAADRGTPFAETLGALDQLHKAGKFVKLGISNFSAYEVAEIVMTCKANGWVRPSVYQAMYNCMTRGIEAELLPACRRYGIDVVVYNPIAGGLLSGKIKTADMVPADGRFSDTASSGKMYRNRYFRESIFNALAKLEAATAKHGLSMVETALRWTAYHSALKVTDGNDGLIIGASSGAQLDANLTDIEKGPLPKDLVDEVNTVWEMTKADSVPYWHMDLNYSYELQ